MRDYEVTGVQTCALPICFLNEAECPKFEAELRERYEKLRQNYHEEQAKIASLSEARKNKLELF